MLRNHCGDFRAEAPAFPAFVRDDQAAGLFHRLEYRFFIERTQRARIDHFDVDAVVSQLDRGLQRGIDHGQGGHHGAILTVALDRRLADGNGVALFRHQTFLADVEQLVFEEDDGVVFADGAG